MISHNALFARNMSPQLFNPPYDANDNIAARALAFLGSGIRQPTFNTPASNVNIIYTLGPYDILFGRCKTCFNNIGNRRFRITMSMHLKAYMATKNRQEKTSLFQSIVSSLQNEAGARFLKPIKGGRQGYIQLGVKQAREKVGHALRDLVMTRYQSTISDLTSKKTDRLVKTGTQAKEQESPKQRQSKQKPNSKSSTSMAEPSFPRYLDEIEIIKKPIQDIDEEQSICSSLDGSSMGSVSTEVSNDRDEPCLNYGDMIAMPMTI